MKKIILQFITMFIFFSATTYFLNAIFRSSEMDVYDLGTPLGLSLGISFLHGMFFKETKD